MEKRKSSLKPCRNILKPSGHLFAYNVCKSTSNKENEGYTGSLSNMIKTKLAKFEEDLEKSKKRHNIKREISLKSLIKNVKRNELGDYCLSHKLRNSSNMLRESCSQNLSIKLASNENSIIKHHRNDSSLSKLTTNASYKNITLVNTESNYNTRNKTIPASSTNYNPQDLIKMFNKKITNNCCKSEEIIISNCEKEPIKFELVKNSNKCRNNKVIAAVKSEQDQLIENYEQYEKKMLNDHIRTASKYNYTDNPSVILTHDNSSPSYLNLWYLCFGVPLNDLLDETDKVLCEGKVFKYKPGLSNVYSERWMQITENGIIRIYKDQIQSLYNPKNPLAAIPLSVIEGIKKVNLKNPVLRNNISIEKKEKLSILNKNQFMLLYKEEAIKKILAETDKVLKSDRGSVQNDENAFQPNISESNMSESNIEFVYKNVDTDFSVSDVGCISKLSLPPSYSISLTANEICHTPTVDDETCEERNPDYRECRSNISYSKLKIKQKTVQNKNLWSSRESEWIFNDKRLLFATEDGETRRKWIQIFKYAVRTHYKY